MALDVDAVIDRRRLSRRVALWRGLAILIIIAGVAAFAYTRFEASEPHVARVAVTGAITYDRPMLKLIERLEKSKDVAAVLISINSPGGTSVGGERLYDALRELDKTKPIVAHINTLGASAAYMTAMASDHIVAQRTSLTGSIGVLIQYGQISEMLDHLGIKVAKVDSGPLKAEPNPFEPVEPDAVAALQSVVDDTFEYFLGLVVERRSMPRAKALQLADGRIYTGKQALDNGLIDAIGDEDDARLWLALEHEVPIDLKVRDYKPSRDSDLPFVSRITSEAVTGILGGLGIANPPSLPVGSVDGLWSIWQAPAVASNTGSDR